MLFAAHAARRSQEQSADARARYTAAQEYESALAAWRAAGDESAPKPEKPFEPRYGHRNVLDQYVSALKMALGCHVPGCRRHHSPTDAAQISLDLQVLARFAGDDDVEDEQAQSAEEAAKEAAEATQHDFDTSSDEDDLELDEEDEAEWYASESAERSQTETPRYTQPPSPRSSQEAHSQAARKAALEALSPLALARIYGTPGDEPPGAARHLRGSLTRGRLSGADADPFADPPVAMDVDAWRDANDLEPSLAAQPWSSSQLVAE